MPDATNANSRTVDWDRLLTRQEVQMLVELALIEDIGGGDLTTDSIFTEPQRITGRIAARSRTVVCGIPMAAHLLRRLDSSAVVTQRVPEGERAAAGDLIAEVEADVRAVLSSERCILNFLMRLCGIANATRKAVDMIPTGTRAHVYDTRKTVPGWRHLDKAAVCTGGGRNHRIGLFDAVMVKDNHIAAAGSITNAVERVRRGIGTQPCDFIEVEVDTLEQLDEALDCAPDVILLDNFTVEQMREAVERTEQRNPEIELEASGGITISRIAPAAETGVHRISLGALTHTVLPADIGMDF